MAFETTTRERVSLDLHNQLIKKAEDLIPVLKKRSEAATLRRSQFQMKKIRSALA